MVECKYDAWGKIIGRTGSLASTLGYLNPFRYRGYVYDEETGLYYLRSRYYNPEWGRFINADGIIITQHPNLFAYCENRVALKYDPDGYASSDIDDDVDPLRIELYGGGGIPGRIGARTVFSHVKATPKSPNVNNVNNASFSLGYTTEQQIIISYAKQANKLGGLSLEDANILGAWSNEYNLKYQLHQGHHDRAGFISSIWHVHIGPINHIPIIPYHYVR